MESLRWEIPSIAGAGYPLCHPKLPPWPVLFVFFLLFQLQSVRLPPATLPTDVALVQLLPIFRPCSSCVPCASGIPTWPNHVTGQSQGDGEPVQLDTSSFYMAHNPVALAWTRMGQYPYGLSINFLAVVWLSGAAFVVCSVVGFFSYHPP